ncbi:hypothetical protein KC19_4G163600 [Ceratodon purpureus]|uniref:BURP domain-containing protein n=1 Tax=Ceratodon purpureus TaxID=3225 RepID=A0A8T0IBK4_CERPU|nr:hypothetical protein KC19_4G163600 [Ceratodon purpureus]
MMAANNMGTTLILLIVVILGAGVAGHEGHEGSAIKYWEKKLPGVQVPQPLREAVSPVEGSMLAGVFAMQIKHELTYPSASASFCKKAGLVCADEKVDRLDKSAYHYKGPADDKSTYWYKGGDDKSAYMYKGADDKPVEEQLDKSAYMYKGGDDKSAYTYKGADDKPVEEQLDKSAYMYKGGDDKSAYTYKGADDKPVEEQLDKSAYMYKGGDDKSAYTYKGADDKPVKEQLDKFAYMYKGAAEKPAENYQLDKSSYMYKGADDNPAQKQLDNSAYMYKGADDKRPAEKELDKSAYMYKGADEKSTENQLDKSAYMYKGADDNPAEKQLDKSAYMYKGADDNPAEKQLDKSAYMYKGADDNPAEKQLDKSAYMYKGADDNPAEKQLDKSAYMYKGADEKPAEKQLDKSAYMYKGADEKSGGNKLDKSAYWYKLGADEKSAYHYKADDKSASTRKVDEVAVPSKGYFLETDLFEGATMRLKEQAAVQPKPFMPRVVADALPELKPENLHKLQRIFDIEEGTDMYNALDFATAVCDKTTALDGEDRVCPASLESFADFLSAHVGPDVKVLTSSSRPRVVMGPMKVTNFTVHHSVDDNINVVICHILNFPSEMYMCHSVPDTKVIEASMTDADGMEIRAVGICHLDTKMWTPEHQSFRILGSRPGTPVCHWNAQELLVFYGTNSKKSAVIKETAVHAHGEMAMAKKGGHDHMGM